ncbi:MAG: hypothetical protein HY841_03585 [Bacteroidetes bacterium]|nr:hypothetical protein [Bacteroidota bacterium]
MPQKRKPRAKWKKLTPGQEQKIVDDYNAGMKRNPIILKHKIAEGQFVSILKKTADEAHLQDFGHSA